MINASDFAPLISPLAPQAIAAPASARAAQAASPASWFDAAAVSGDTSITASLDPASRGLSVDQHAARVLGHLCGTREDGA